MNSNYKIIALDLQNATLENLNHWFLTTDFITAEATKDYLRYRVKDEENTIHLIYIINDFLFGTTSKEDYPLIDIPEYLINDIVEYCIPIQLSEIESYRSVIIDWIFNTDTTKSKTAFEIKHFQKYTVDFDEIIFPHFISCVTCIDVEELGFNLKEFFQPLNQKFKAIHTEFKKYYPRTQYLHEVKLTKIYILDKYILGYSFRLENEPYEHFFYNIHLESLLHQITPFQFDDKPKLTVDSILEKINRVGIENLTNEEQEFLNNLKQ